MSALNTLTHDHRRITDLFELIQQSDDSRQRRVLFQEVKKELRSHTELEESILYPQLDKFEELNDFVEGSYDEHQEIKDIVQEIDEIEDEAQSQETSASELSTLHDELESALEELIDVVSYHVEEEEEKLFPRILDLMTVSELDRLEDALTSEVANRSGESGEQAA
jgi:iron-sulfur cluster repair protein YtfE (RIC family)